MHIILSMENSSIIIIGAGRIGRALQSIFKNKSLPLQVLDIEILEPDEQERTQITLKTANIVFLCTPSGAIRQFLELYGKSIAAGTRLVILSKGLDAETGVTLDDLVKKLSPHTTPVLFYGPMLSDEIMAGKGGCGVCASEDTQAAQDIQKLFDDSPISVEITSDVKGVALAGVLKNVYAVVLGLAQGLNWGDNRLGTLVAKTALEMERFIEAQGGSGDTAWGTAGLGDLLATGYGAYSKNRRTGMALAKGETPPEESEGVWSIQIIQKHFPHATQFPIFQAIAGVINKTLKPEEALRRVAR